MGHPVRWMGHPVRDNRSTAGVDRRVRWPNRSLALAARIACDDGTACIGAVRIIVSPTDLSRRL